MDNSLTPNFDARGLAPAIVQDAVTGQVLMLAWMNAAALELTLETGEAHFWSRSRQEIWHKGASSGNLQQVVEVRLDCDGDALLLRVNPSGPACHTGNRSCFYRQMAANQETELDEQSLSGHFNLSRLFATIRDRRDHPKQGSYTARLFEQGEDEIIKKVGEEAIEVVLAAKAQGNQRLVEEIADLTYHLLVLLAAHDLNPDMIETELAHRHQ